MEIIPIVHLKNRKIEETGDSWSSFNKLLERVDSEKIYFLDRDGIEKDKPNLCLYQRVSEHRKIWVDAGPRVLGDVVDAVMAGAINITLRRNLWPDLDIAGIREITENEIYVDINLASNGEYTSMSYHPDIDGVVIFREKTHIKADFKFGSVLKNLCSKYKLYVYESESKNISYWKKLGIRGFLVDLPKMGEFKNHGL